MAAIAGMRRLLDGADGERMVDVVPPELAPSALSARNLLRSLLRDASMMSTSHTPHLSSLTDLILDSGNVPPPFA